MKRHKSEELNFNLLALCGDNLADVRQKLAANIRRLADLEAKFGSSNNPDWQPKKTNPDDIICSATDSRLATYQLDAEDIQAVPESEVKQPEAPESSDDDETVESGLKLWEELAEEQKLLREQYESELGMTGQEPSAVLGRTKDYTPAIHEWVKKLADRGVLRRLHEEVKLQNVP
jgi:ubiquitin carboxyl-terminal hydrolase L5